MNETRVTVYRSWTAVCELQDVQAMAPERDLAPVIERIAGTLVGEFGKGVVGYTWDMDIGKLYVTFKRQVDAERLANDWGTVMELLKSGQ